MEEFKSISGKKSRDFSAEESCSSMKEPTQNLLHEFKAVAFEKEELDSPELTAHFPLLTYQDSNSDVGIRFHNFYKRTDRFRYKTIKIDT